MSASGHNPSFKWLNLEPQAADPTSPNEGDVFRSDGTPRDEGLWVYENAAWAQISTGATLSTLDSLTLTPQSSDPGSPTEGMVFRSDGTPRAEGIWEYQNGDWTQITGLRYQEFVRKEPVEVRLATTAAITLANQLENGDTIDSVVLATGDKVLVKNQVTASENGVYTVNASGAPTRHTSADTFSELNGYVAWVRFGTTNRAGVFFQTSVLTSLSDSQVWSATPPTETFTVPEGVYHLKGEVYGGGGGGGASARDTASAVHGTGGGGAGSIPVYFNRKVTPGDSITVNVGKGGNAQLAIFQGGTNTGATGGTGGSSILTFTDGTITVPGGLGGTGGSDTGVAGVGAVNTVTKMGSLHTAGGNGSTQSVASNTSGADSIYASGGAAVATVNNGGGGGAGKLAGAAGNTGTNADANVAAASSGAGGAGVGWASANLTYRSGWGGSGYVRFEW